MSLSSSSISTKANIEAKDDIFGQSPLLWAAENGHEGTVRLLLEYGAPIESTNKYRQTALWLGVRNDHNAVVKFLAERNAIVDMEDNASRTPLRIAHFLRNDRMQVMLEKHTKFKDGVKAGQASGPHDKTRAVYDGVIGL